MLEGELIVIGNRLRISRENLDISRQELSKLTDIDVRMLARYEADEVNPSGEVVAKLAKALIVSTDYLLGVTADPTPNDFQLSQLSATERAAIAAWRRGDKLEAMKTIMNDEKAANGV